jgi:hypothetical protein
MATTTSAASSATGNSGVAASQLQSRAEHFRFLRDDQDLAAEPKSEAEAAARAEYDRVFKEFAIADLSQYRQGRMGMRWRTESEVVGGKGQTICANQTCVREANLCSYEVDFAYREHGVETSALVKVRLCPKCTKRMFKARRQERDDRDDSESVSSASRSRSKSKSRSRSKRRLDRRREGHSRRKGRARSGSAGGKAETRARGHHRDRSRSNDRRSRRR